MTFNCIVGKIQDDLHLCKVKTINYYNFWQNRSRCTISLSTIDFSGEPDLVVWPESSSDNALWVNTIWPPIKFKQNSHQTKIGIILERIEAGS